MLAQYGGYTLTHSREQVLKDPKIYAAKVEERLACYYYTQQLCTPCSPACLAYITLTPYTKLLQAI